VVVVTDHSEADEADREMFFKKLGLRHFGRMKVDTTWSLWAAYALVLFAALGGILFLYAAFVSKLMPNTGVWLLDAMKEVKKGHIYLAAVHTFAYACIYLVQRDAYIQMHNTLTQKCTHTYTYTCRTITSASSCRS